MVEPFVTFIDLAASEMPSESADCADCAKARRLSDERQRKRDADETEALPKMGWPWVKD